MQEKGLVTYLEQHKSELLGNKNIKRDELTGHYIMSADPNGHAV